MCKELPGRLLGVTWKGCGPVVSPWPLYLVRPGPLVLVASDAELVLPIQARVEAGVEPASQGRRAPSGPSSRAGAAELRPPDGLWLPLRSRCQLQVAAAWWPRRGRGHRGSTCTAWADSRALEAPRWFSRVPKRQRGRSGGRRAYTSVRRMFPTQVRSATWPGHPGRHAGSTAECTEPRAGGGALGEQGWASAW